MTPVLTRLKQAMYLSGATSLKIIDPMAKQIIRPMIIGTITDMKSILIAKGVCGY